VKNKPNLTFKKFSLGVQLTTWYQILARVCFKSYFAQMPFRH
jgi:hypothetical protein